MKKEALIGFCIVLLLLIPSVSSINVANLNFNTVTNSDFNISLPDLVIEEIVFEEGHFPFSWDIICRVKNIGGNIAFGNIKLSLEVKHLLFGFIPRKTVRTFSYTYKLPINPGETKNFDIASTTQFPSFGFYKLFYTINPNKSIEESRYFNNYFNQSYFIFFLGSWYEI